MTYKDTNERLFDCIADKDLEGVRTALRDGADANARRENGEPALHYATISSSEPIIILLLESGADINSIDKFGYTPLGIAITCKSWYSNNLVKVFIEKGADVSSPEVLKAVSTEIHSFGHINVDQSMELLDILEKAGLDGANPLRLKLLQAQTIDGVTNDSSGSQLVEPLKTTDTE